MTKIWQPTPEILAQLCQQSTLNNAVIKGLGRKRWAFMLAAPGVGKSSLMIATALEVALGQPIIGLLPEQAPPRKILYWAHEDRASELSHRLLQIRRQLTEPQQALFEQNFGILDSEHPIFCSANAADKTQLATEKARTELIKSINEFNADLVIIDCIRTVKGDADVVADEIHINLAMREMALATNAAFIAVHHLTKAAAQDPSLVTNTSGTGLSEAQSESKLHLYLRSDKEKGQAEPVLKLSHIKANFLPTPQWLVDVVLMQHDSGLLYNPSLYTPLHHDDRATLSSPLKAPSTEIKTNQDPTSTLTTSLSTMEQYLVATESQLKQIDPVVVDVAAKKAALHLDKQTNLRVQPDIFGMEKLSSKNDLLRAMKKDLDK